MALLTKAVEHIMEPQSGKRYTLNGTNPQGDSVAMDETNNQQVVIPKDQMGKMQTVVQPGTAAINPPTTAPSSTMPQPMQPFTMSSLVSELVTEAGMSAEELAQHLHGDISTEHMEIARHQDMIQNDLDEIQEDQDALQQVHANSDLLQNIVGAGGRSTASRSPNPKFAATSKQWQEKRKELLEARRIENELRVHASTVPITHMPLQDRVIKERGLSAEAKAYQAKVDATGHDSKTNLPVGETKKIEVGMTEFPKDQKKGKDEGYKIPFKEMDVNHVSEREHFDNERRLPLYNMQRRELDLYKDDPKGGKKNLGLSEQQKQSAAGEEPAVNIGKEASLEEQALRSALGFSDLPTSQPPDVIERVEQAVWTEISQQHNNWSAIEADLRAGTFPDCDGCKFDDSDLHAIQQYVHYRADQVMRAATSSKTAAEDVPSAAPAAKEPQQGPVVHKNMKKAPGTNDFEEPAMIPRMEGKGKEAITKLRKVQEDIAALAAQIQGVQKPFQESMNTAVKPLNEQMTSQKKLLQSYIDMAYNSLMAGKSTVAAYEQSIFASLEQLKETTPNVTLSQVLARLEALAPELAAKVEEVKTTIQKELSQQTLEKTLYEYPISKSHEKRIQSSTQSSLISVLQHVITAANDIISLVTQELDTINV